MNNIDWNKVEKDAKLLVRNSENDEWVRRHYAGMSSYTDDGNVCRWRFAKLYEE